MSRIGGQTFICIRVPCMRVKMNYCRPHAPLTVGWVHEKKGQRQYARNLFTICEDFKTTHTSHVSLWAFSLWSNPGCFVFSAFSAFCECSAIFWVPFPTNSCTWAKWWEKSFWAQSYHIVIAHFSIGMWCGAKSEVPLTYLVIIFWAKRFYGHLVRNWIFEKNCVCDFNYKFWNNPLIGILNERTKMKLYRDKSCIKMRYSDF